VLYVRTAVGVSAAMAACSIVSVLLLVVAQSSLAYEHQTQHTKTQYYPTGELELVNGVYEVGEPNWEHFQRQFPVRLVYFHIPWCKHCKQFGPTYDQLAVKFKQLVPGIALAKVDVAHWPPLQKQYNVETVPCLKLFWLDKNATYDGERDPTDLQRWLTDALAADMNLNLQDNEEHEHDTTCWCTAGIAGAMATSLLGAFVYQRVLKRKDCDETKKTQ